MVPEKDWINISTALITPAIALAGICFALANHILAKKKHKDDLELAQKKHEDDLFDRRFELFEKLVKLWFYYNARDLESPEDNPFPFSGDDTGYLILKTGFLFDKEIESVVKRMVTKSLVPHVPDSEPEGIPRELFEKYLNVK